MFEAAILDLEVVASQESFTFWVWIPPLGGGVTDCFHFKLINSNYLVQIKCTIKLKEPSTTV